MDKFLVALPRSSKHSHAGTTRLESQKVIGVKRSPPDDQKENKISMSADGDDDIFAAPVKKTTHSKKLQMYLDFGQKSLNETIQCPRCNLLYMKHDLEDLKQHEKFCEKVELPPQLAASVIQSLVTVTEWSGESERIVWAKKFQKESKLKLKDAGGYNAKSFFKAAGIVRLMEMMKLELGAVDEFVRLCLDILPQSNRLKSWALTWTCICS